MDPSHAGPEVHHAPAGRPTLAEGLAARALEIERRILALGDQTAEGLALLAITRRVRRSLDDRRIQFVLDLPDPDLEALPPREPIAKFDWNAPPPPALQDQAPEPDRLGRRLAQLRRRA